MEKLQLELINPYLMWVFFCINGTFFLVIFFWWVSLACDHKSFSPLLFRILVREYPISFIVGLVSNVLLCVLWGFFNFNGGPNGDPASPTDALKFIGFISIVYGTLAVWAAPFIYCLARFRQKVNDYYQFRLMKELMNLEDHLVIFGLGDLGKEVCQELSDRKLLHRREPLDFLVLESVDRHRLKPLDFFVLEPEREVDGTKSRWKRYMKGETNWLRAKSLKVSKKIVIVDRDESLFSWVRETSLGKIGLAKINEREELYGLALVGDVKEETVWKACNFDLASFFITSIPGFSPVHYAYKRMKQYRGKSQRKLKGGIAVARTSVQKDSFFPRVSEEGIFFEYPTHQMGIDLAETVFAANLRCVQQKNKNCRILISAPSWQVLYLAEGLELYRKKLGSKVQEPDIYVFTDEQKVLNRVEGPGKKLGSIDVFNWSEAERQTSRQGEMHFKVIIDCPDKRTTDSGERLRTIRKILDEVKPCIVVLSHNKTGKLLGMLHEWIIAAETVANKARGKTGGQFEYPTLIVGTVAEETRGHVRDALIYYDAHSKQAQNMYFPLQSVDCNVNLYSDTKEEIGAIIEAIAREGTKYGGATGIYLCLQGKPGGMGQVLSKLAKLEFKPPDISKYPEYPKKGDKPYAISFHHCRFTLCPYGQGGDKPYFSLSGVVSLRPFEMEENKIKIPEISEVLRQGLVTLKDADVTASLSELLKLLGVECLSVKQNSKWGEIEKCECEYRTTCPIGSYRRRIETLLEKKNLYQNLGLKKENYESAIGRFFIKKEAGPLPANGEEDIFFAKIDLCISHGDTPGALATAVNNLLLREINWEETEQMSGENGKVFDITFLVNYLTYNPNIIQKEIYGNTVTRSYNNQREKLEKGVIEAIQISPFVFPSNGPDLWKKYYENFLKECFPAPKFKHENGNYLIYKSGEYFDSECKEKSLEERCDLQRRYVYLRR